MEPPSEPEYRPVHLGEDALAAVSVELAMTYEARYGERPLDSHAALNGDLLAWVFDDGLSPADESLLRRGREDSLRRFRQHFFEAIGKRLEEAVERLTGVPVHYSFFGFDPPTRTTHGIFVLVLSTPELEKRRAVLGWSEQVRRDAARSREEHSETGEPNRALTERVREERERMTRQNEPGDGRSGPRSA